MINPKEPKPPLPLRSGHVIKQYVGHCPSCEIEIVMRLTRRNYSAKGMSNRNRCAHTFHETASGFWVCDKCSKTRSMAP